MSEPAAPAPQGRYVPAVLVDGLVHSAGMTPRDGGVLTVTGRVGDTVDLHTASEAAALAVRNAVSACASAAGGAHRLGRAVRMTVFVACTTEFTALSAVADGASTVLAEMFGADRLPARSAIGVLALPGGAPVEVELTMTVRRLDPGGEGDGR